MHPIIKSLIESDGTNEKIAILTKCNDIDIKRAFYLAYDKTQTFGIKKIPEYTKVSTDISLAQAMKILEDYFVTRNITGGAATIELTRILQNVTYPDVIERIIKGDMDCGVNRGTIDKVWPGLLADIPQMLATPQSEKALENITYPAYADLKADGARCFATMIKDQEPLLNSRNSSVYMGLERLTKALKDPILENYVLDGELVYIEEKTGLDLLLNDAEDSSPDDVLANRQKGNGIVNKSLSDTIGQTEQSNIVYQVWDIVPVDVYYGRSKSVMPLKQRRALLESVVKSLGTRCIQIIETTVVNSIEEATAVYRNYVQLGLEGIILKNMLSVWENTRSADYVKFKEEIMFDGKIVGYNPHKKDPNKIGSFIVESACGNLRVNVGSGMKDKTHVKVKGSKTKVYIPLDERPELDRELCMSFIDEMMNTILEIKCNGLVTRKNKKAHEPKYSLFLPRVIRRRHDKSVANTVEEAFGDY
ncbi:MAG: hypothetical protein [Caudoviricetes sp.]|nr:MAG: hypothetical protein [Caudoviricetes sp.]